MRRVLLVLLAIFVGAVVGILQPVHGQVTQPTTAAPYDRLDESTPDLAPPGRHADRSLVVFWQEEAAVVGQEKRKKMVSPLGVEPRTNRLRVCCSAN